MKLNKKLIKVVCFCLIFCLLFVNIQNVFQAKWDNDYKRVKNYYAERNSTEIVCIGSSHIHYSINPLLLYKQHGYTSYDFSSAGQDWSTALLYVKETLKNDVKPKLIILDVLGLQKISLSEAHHRKGVDPIENSLDKINQIKYTFFRNQLLNVNVEYDSFASYVLPLLRYHNRWNNLHEEDFEILSDTSKYFFGYTPHYNTVAANFNDYEKTTSWNNQALEMQKELFYEIVSTCKEDDVELLLIKTPSPMWRKDYNELISEWASEYKVPFIDYNTILDEIGIDVFNDFSDATSHLNDSGAEKITAHLGMYLKDNYELTDFRNNENYSIWEDSYEYYLHDKKAFFLSREKDWKQYIDKLQDDDYTIFISVKDNIGGTKNRQLVEELEKLGLGEDVKQKGTWSYLAIVDKGEILYEKLAKESLILNKKISDNEVKLVSANYDNGNDGKIIINGEEYFVNHRGIGIVVYDSVLKQVVDNVTFDLWDGGKAYRN